MIEVEGQKMSQFEELLEKHERQDEVHENNSSNELANPFSMEMPGNFSNKMSQGKDIAHENGSAYPGNMRVGEKRNHEQRMISSIDMNKEDYEKYSLKDSNYQVNGQMPNNNPFMQNGHKDSQSRI